MAIRNDDVTDQVWNFLSLFVIMKLNFSLMKLISSIAIKTPSMLFHKIFVLFMKYVRVFHVNTAKIVISMEC